jgi:hypothetical protein
MRDVRILDTRGSALLCVCVCVGVGVCGCVFAFARVYVQARGLEESRLAGAAGASRRSVAPGAAARTGPEQAWIFRVLTRLCGPQRL